MNDILSRTKYENVIRHYTLTSPFLDMGCKYKVTIVLTNLSTVFPVPYSIRISNLFNKEEKCFEIVTGKNDRRRFSELVFLLSAKLKYDLMSGMLLDASGFLHSKEIRILNEKGLTKVQKTVYAALNRLYNHAKRDEASPEAIFLKKIFIEPDQLRHFICSFGGTGARADSQDLVWWLNVGPDDVFFLDESGYVINEDVLKKELSKIFRKMYLIKDNEWKTFINKHYYGTQGVNTLQTSTNASIYLKGHNLIEGGIIMSSIRHTLRNNALIHLREKLKPYKEDDYQRLELECSLIEKGIRKRNDYDTNELSKPFPKYIISSDAGTGKTCFLRDLQLKLLDKNDFIPIFVNASEIEEWRPKDILELISLLLEEAGYSLSMQHTKTVINNALKNNLVFLLVDGLDQIRSGEYQELIEKVILKLATNNLIITSRPSAVINIEESSEFIFLRIKPFSVDTQKVYFGKYYKRACELATKDADLISVPMLACMIRILIKEKEDKEIKNRKQLFDRFINYIFVNYKHGKSKFKPDVRIQLRQNLAKLAWAALSEERPYLQRVPLHFCYEKDCLPDDPRGLKADQLTKSGVVNLIVEYSGINKESDYLVFTHLSFQEYLASEWINQNEKFVDNFLNVVINDLKKGQKIQTSFVGPRDPVSNTTKYHSQIHNQPTEKKRHYRETCFSAIFKDEHFKMEVDQLWGSGKQWLGTEYEGYHNDTRGKIIEFMESSTKEIITMKAYNLWLMDKTEYTYLEVMAMSLYSTYEYPLINTKPFFNDIINEVNDYLESDESYRDELMYLLRVLLYFYPRKTSLFIYNLTLSYLRTKSYTNNKMCQYVFCFIPYLHLTMSELREIKEAVLEIKKKDRYKAVSMSYESIIEHHCL